MANHTSPIDVIILASDGYYAMVRYQATCMEGAAELVVGQEVGSKSPLSM